MPRLKESPAHAADCRRLESTSRWTPSPVGSPGQEWRYCSSSDPSLCPVGALRCPVTKRLVKPCAVVKVEVSPVACRRGGHALVILEIDLLVLDAAPQSLDKNIVQGPTASIHADPDLQLLEPTCEHHTRELRALVGVDDLWPPLRLQRPIERRQAKARLHTYRQLPGQHISAVPVDHSHEVDVPCQQSNVDNVCTPDLVRALDPDAAQQVRIDPMPGGWLAQPRLRVDRLQSHLPHQARHSLVIDLVVVVAQPCCQPPDPVERCPRVLRVYQTHQIEVLARLPQTLVIEARPGQPGQLALPCYAQF